MLVGECGCGCVYYFDRAVVRVFFTGGAAGTVRAFFEELTSRKIARHSLTYLRLLPKVMKWEPSIIHKTG